MRSLIKRYALTLFVAAISLLVSIFASEVGLWTRILIGAQSTLIGFGLNLAFNINRRFEGLAKKFWDQSSVQEDLLNGLKALIANESRAKEIASVFQSGIVDDRFAKCVLDLEMEAVHQVPVEGKEQYYSLLRVALNNAKQWDAIHHGSIQVLVDDRAKSSRPAQKYYSVLSEVSKERDFRARRIIIGNETDKKVEDELRDPEIRRAYLSSAGEIETYFISYSNYKVVMADIGVQDAEFTLRSCARYNEHLLLQYKDDRKVLEFGTGKKPGRHEKAMTCLYQALDESLDKRWHSANGFSHITSNDELQAQENTSG